MQAPSQLSKKWVVIVIATIVLLLAVIWRGISSKSGHASNAWLYESPEVRALIGPIRRIRLTEHEEAVFQGRAEYWVDVEGLRGHLQAHLELVKDGDHWIVVRHELWP